MRACALSAVLAVLGAIVVVGCAATPPSPAGLSEPFDLYNPIQLNERAAAAVKAGDLQSAWILLERAARIAPHDPRIARNLDILRAARLNTLTETPPPESIAFRQPDARTGTSLAEPPPIWPTR